MLGSRVPIFWSYPIRGLGVRYLRREKFNSGGNAGLEHHDGDHMRPYLRVANVLENKLDLSDVKMMNFTPEEFKTFALLPGDLLLNEGQAPNLLGRPAMYRGEIEGCCFQKTLLRFRAHSWTLPEFALLVFRHYMHSGRFKKESRITTNIGHLTQVRFVVMEFPLPPLNEQRVIVDLFSQSLDEAETELRNIPDASQLKQSILQVRLRGPPRSARPGRRARDDAARASRSAYQKVRAVAAGAGRSPPPLRGRVRVGGRAMPRSRVGSNPPCATGSIVDTSDRIHG